MTTASRAAAVLLSACLIACANQECSESRDLKPEEYWFWEAYTGVMDLQNAAGMRKGRMKINPSVCFSVASGDLQNPGVRTEGYRKAVAEWLMWLPGSSVNWDSDTKSAMARKRLTELTGQRFTSATEWQKWWDTNREKISWSDRAQQLVTSDDRAATSKEDERGKRDVISAVEYWFLMARGWLRNPESTATSLVGDAWRPPHGSAPVTISKSEINDRNAKHKGYLDAVRAMILDGISLPGLPQSDIQTLIQRLRAITDQAYSEPKDWVRWWTQNAGSLVLSKDGERLISKNGER